VPLPQTYPAIQHFLKSTFTLATLRSSLDLAVAGGERRGKVGVISGFRRRSEPELVVGDGFEANHRPRNAYWVRLFIWLMLIDSI
jgi:hypothetical protein